MFKIFKLANIRRIIDNNFENSSQYFDVMEKIILPSEDGEYSNYDAVAIVNKEQGKFIENIVKNYDEINMAIIIV
jgi:hypothetical protein